MRIDLILTSYKDYNKVWDIVDACQNLLAVSKITKQAHCEISDKPNHRYEGKWENNIGRKLFQSKPASLLKPSLREYLLINLSRQMLVYIPTTEQEIIGYWYTNLSFIETW